jgi:hypothetical protein
MPHLSGAARTEALRKKREELDKKLRESQAQDKAQEKEQTRRRHEIAGRLALVYVDANPDSDFTRFLAQQLHASLTKPADRVLFPALALAAPDLPPPPPADNTQAA